MAIMTKTNLVAVNLSKKKKAMRFCKRYQAKVLLFFQNLNLEDIIGFALIMQNFFF